MRFWPSDRRDLGLRDHFGLRLELQMVKAVSGPFLRSLVTGSMTDKRDKPAKAAPQTREDRLKAALKANMGKRKAQAKARKASDTQEKE